MEEATVTRIIDGDTAELSVQGAAPVSVRFIGVDTAERGQPYFNESTAYATAELSGKTVHLEKDVSQTDQFQRLLRYVG